MIIRLKKIVSVPYMDIRYRLLTNAVPSIFPSNENSELKEGSGSHLSVTEKETKPEINSVNNKNEMEIVQERSKNYFEKEDSVSDVSFENPNENHTNDHFIVENHEKALIPTSKKYLDSTTVEFINATKNKNFPKGKLVWAFLKSYWPGT